MKLKHVKLRLFVLAPLLFCLSTTDVLSKRLPVRIFTSADGLGSSFVNYLARDSRGFMWFCTRDGLSRFDGAQFVTYQIGEQNAPPGIEHILETRDGAYWITTTSGTYRFDPQQQATRNPNTPTLHAEFMFADRGRLYEDRAGNLWHSSNRLAQVEYRDGKAVLTKVELGLPVATDSGLIVSEVQEATDGSLWISTSVGMLRKLPSGGRVFYSEPGPPEKLIGTIRMLLDKRGFVWQSRGNKLFVINPEVHPTIGPGDELLIRPIVSNRTISLMPEAAFALPSVAGEIYEFRHPDFIDKRFAKDLFQTSDGSVWITCEDTLLEFSAERLNVYGSAEGLSVVMNDVAEDGVGNLWIAGQSSLARLDRNGLVSFGKEDGTGSDRILGIFAGPQGVIHVSTTDANIASFDGSRFHNVRPAIESTSQLWTSRPVMFDSRGDWWLLTTNKLFRFSGAANAKALAGKKPAAVYGREEGFISDGMFQIFEDSRGTIWVSTRANDATQNGLSRLIPGEEKWQTFSAADGLPPLRSPSSFAEDKDGNIWIAVFEGAVLRYDGTRFHDVASAVGLSANTVITDIHFDRLDRLWLTSSSAGAIRVDDASSDKPVAQLLTTANGLSSNNVRTVAEDLFGRIYFGTARGVDRLSPETGQVRRFSVADGLPADFVSDSMRDSLGNIWFATNSGVARLTPVPDTQPHPPSIWLGGIRVAGEPQPVSELGMAQLAVGDLADWQNNLQIEFFGVEFRAGETLRYQYKLEGADADWSQPDTSRSVTFANLRPGTYRFLVRGVNSIGVVSEQPAVVNFNILPPIWLRWWFLLIAGVLIALALVLLFRYRTANLRRVNRALSEAKLAEESLRKAREERLAEIENVRARIATDLHDDIGASLTQIAILSEVAQAKAAAGNGANIDEPLTRITHVSNELVDTMSDIVWAINPAKDHLSDLTQRMRRVAADLLSPRSILVHFSSREEDRAQTIKTNARREVFLIFKESVNNIAKHSGAKNVSIDLEIEQDVLLLRIRDDGNGFVCGPPSFDDTFSSEGASGNGIRNMRKRAREMGGRFDIESAPGGGTTTFLELPLDATHITKA